MILEINQIVKLRSISLYAPCILMLKIDWLSILIKVKLKLKGHEKRKKRTLFI